MNFQKNHYKFEKYKWKKEKMLQNDLHIPLAGRKMIRPILRGILKVSRKMQGYSIEFLGDKEIPKGAPVIFAVSHIGKLDFEIVSEVIKEQYYVLAADFCM